jgi:hypothetical protein
MPTEQPERAPTTMIAAAIRCIRHASETRVRLRNP